MRSAFGTLPARGAEPASTSGRSVVVHRTVRHTAKCWRAPKQQDSRCGAQTYLAQRGVGQRLEKAVFSCKSSPSSVSPGLLATSPEEVDAHDTTPHPSLPDGVSPEDLMQKADIAALKEQVAEMRALVMQQKDVIYSQRAAIEQLTQTLQEELRRANGGVSPTAFSPLHSGVFDTPLSPLVPPRHSTPPMAPAPAPRPFEAQAIAYGDRRLLGGYDARFHSTSSGATPRDYRILPEKIILVRHAESEGNVDNKAYTYIPDSQVPLTPRGHMQAYEAGKRIKGLMEEDPLRRDDYRLFFYISPYKRSLQTYEGICSQFAAHHLLGVQEEVQLREQDFGNFQDHEGKQREKAERVRFGRFFYRFPNGESGADVYDRITIFEDHMIRDINAGRFASSNTALVLVTHGLALRVFLMRWFHWTVDEFLSVYNPNNADPLVLERLPVSEQTSWRHTKSLYRLTDESMHALRGCTSDMCSTDHLPRKRTKVSTRLL